MGVIKGKKHICVLLMDSHFNQAQDFSYQFAACQFVSSVFFPVGFIFSDNFCFRGFHSFESNTQAFCNCDRTIVHKMLQCTCGRECFVKVKNVRRLQIFHW